MAASKELRQEQESREIDKRLMEQINKGDWSAFADMVKRYSPSLYRFLYRFTGSSPEAEDLLQETFLRAFKHARSYNPHYSLSTWLFTIARRLAINASCASRLKRVVSLEWLSTKNEASQENLSIDVIDINQNPEEEVNRIEREKMVHNALTHLPERQRTALLLSYFEGLSYEEIAQVMNTSISSIESIIFRAKKSLGKIIVSELRIPPRQIFFKRS